MDKKTILIVVVCVGVLFGTQLVLNKIYPPIPKKPRPVPGATTSTNATPANVVASVTNAVEAVTPVEPERPRAEEQLVALSNEYINVTFTSWGGGIRAVEMLKHRANGHGNVELGGTNAAPALALSNVPGAGVNDVFQIEQPDAKTVVLSASTSDGAKVTKTFSLGADYLINSTVEIQRGHAGAALHNVALAVGLAGPTHPKESPIFLMADWQGGPKFSNRDWKSVSKRAVKGLNGEPINARWVAVESQYFVMLLTASTNAVAVNYATVNLPTPPDWKAKQPPQGLSAAMEIPVSGEIGANVKWALTLYAGPKEYDRLAALGQNQDEVMNFGSWMDLYTGIFGMVLFKSLELVHKVIPSFGLAIILITVALKIVFWPIQAKSIRSMKQMAKFQPLVAKLKEKYKDDPQRLNQETMKLYKEHGVNPFSGCLPMFVQLPVLIGFYKVLSNAIELRGAPFLWIKDLSQSDTIATVAGLPINPLPLVMVGTMVWQQKITPTTGDAQQQKMMMFMPLMMLMFFYNASSGLALYWTVQQLLSIAQQWYSMRQSDAAGGAGNAIAAGKLK